MHELSLVAELVQECERHAAGRRVRAVTVRCAGGVEADEIEAAWSELGGPVLGDAALELELVPTVLRCPCGFSGVLDKAASTGHIAVCPACSAVRPIESPLELVAIRLERAPAAADW